jgi:hypothetical protein
MKVKSNVIMKHLQICGLLSCVEVQTKTFKKTLTTHRINFPQVSKKKENWKHNSNHVFQMS